MATSTKPTPGPLSEELAERLRAQMARKKVSQSSLANAVNLSQAQLSGVLNARKHLDVEKLDEICWVLGLNFRDLIAEIDAASSRRLLAPNYPKPL